MKKITVLLLATLFLSGCDHPLYQKLQNMIAGETAAESNERSEEQNRSLFAEDVVILTADQRRRFYRYFIKEMYREVYARDLRDKQVYGQWMNVLEQKASIEGVYRGLTLSNQYRILERGKASQKVVGFFAFEAARLKLATKSSEDKRRELEKELNKRARGMALFTLKRLLGEEYLAKIDRLNAMGREQLADWYADYCMRMLSYKVDFGLKQRMQKQRDFYKGWAMKNTKGRIQWEVLIRMHMLMNYLGEIVYGTEPSSSQ